MAGYATKRDQRGTTTILRADVTDEPGSAVLIEWSERGLVARLDRTHHRFRYAFGVLATGETVIAEIDRELQLESVQAVMQLKLPTNMNNTGCGAGCTHEHHQVPTNDTNGCGEADKTLHQEQDTNEQAEPQAPAMFGDDFHLTDLAQLPASPFREQALALLPAAQANLLAKPARECTPARRYQCFAGQ